MEKAQVIFAVVFISGLLIIIALFFGSMLLTQRFRANKLFHEKEAMQRDFELKELESRLDVQEKTFAQISQELHDNVGQVLTLAKIQLTIMDQSDQMDKAMLAQARDGISRALVDLRDIAKGLDGDLIQESGFEEVISREAERINRTGFLNIIVSVSGNKRSVNGQRKLIIFRIVQEIFQNIIKHSGAKIVEVKIDYSDDLLCVYINDNGKGFDLAKLRTGSGIANMQRRSQQIGATFAIISNPDHGTRIKIEIPND